MRLSLWARGTRADEHRGVSLSDFGRASTTAIETSKDTLVKMRDMNLSIWVWCQHCMAGHQIKASEATLEGETQSYQP